MVGVYKLHWPDSEYFYIGSSKDCVRRHKSHISSLKASKHCNSKLQEIYNEFGAPKMTLIKECRQKTLIRNEHIILKIMGISEFCCNTNMRKGKKTSFSVSLTLKEYHDILLANNAKTLTQVLLNYLDKRLLKPQDNDTKK